MSDSERALDRRTVLKGLGGAGATVAVGGVGLAAMSGGAAASSLNVSAENVQIETDDGELNRVSIAPNLSGTWEGFDATVGKVRILIEAKPHDVASGYVGEWAPVFRATMWLNETDIRGHEVESGPGLSGEFAVANNEPNEDGHYWFGEDGITLYDADGPDYANLERPEDYFDGTSVGQEYGDGNPYPDGFENGIYDQAGTINRFFNPEDGSWDGTTVTLRYTISFHAPNEAIAEDYDIPSEDVSEHSPLVMADAEDVDSPISADNYPPEAIPYDVLQNHADGHPAIMTAKTRFAVNVHNEPAEGGVSGDSNAAAE